MIFVCSIIALDLVWELTDPVNAFMALPNLLCLLLRKLIVPYGKQKT